MSEIIVIGAIGPSGPRGFSGPSGPRGNTGSGYFVTRDFSKQGPSGPRGPKGIRGLRGSSGITGPSGPRGPSGFVAPNSYGISGPIGAQGVQGEIGPSGPSGFVGQSGPSGIIGSNSLYWFQKIYNFYPNGIGPSGLRGPSGPRYTRQELANGMFMQVFNSNISGPQGPQGDAGPSGSIGPQGSKGLSGPKGPRGISGISGPDNYNTGASGPIGPVGPMGLMGPSGGKGIRGPSGYAGLSFDQNNQPNLSKLIGRNSGLLSIDNKEFINAFSSSVFGQNLVYETESPVLAGPFSTSTNTKCIIIREYSGGGDTWYYMLKAVNLGQSGYIFTNIYRANSGTLNQSIPIYLVTNWEKLYNLASSNFRLGEEYPLNKKYFIRPDSNVPNYIIIKSANDYEIRSTLQGQNPNLINGSNLLELYEKYKNINWPLTIFLSPGIYDLQGEYLKLSSNYIKIIGLGLTREDVIIQSENMINSQQSRKSVGVVDQAAAKIHLENLTIKNTWEKDKNNPQERITNLLNVYNDNVYHRCAFSNSYTKFYTKNLSGVRGLTYKKVIIEKNMSRVGFAGIPIEGDICFIQDTINYSGSGFVFIKEALTSQDISNLGLDGEALGKFVWKFYLAGNIQLNGNMNSPKRDDNIYLVAPFTKISLLAIEKPEARSLDNDFSLDQTLGVSFLRYSPWPWQVKNWSLISQNTQVFSIEIDSIEEMKKSVLKNVNFQSTNYSLSMANYSFYAGTFYDCLAGILSFGGRHGYIMGHFENCIGEDQSFTSAAPNLGEVTIEKSKIINCQAGHLSFGGFSAKVNGFFKDLTINSFWPSYPPSPFVKAINASSEQGESSQLINLKVKIVS